MRGLIVKNATVILPAEVLQNTDVLIENGKIKAIGCFADVGDATVLDAEGKYLFPGFIDIHVHGGGNADFMDATPAAFETAIRTHLAHGTTLLYPTAMSAPEAELAAFIEAYHAFSKESKYAALAPGLHLEGPYFSGAGQHSSGAQKRDSLRLPDEAEANRLLALANGAIVRWDIAPELEGAVELGRMLVEKGVLVAVAHSDATAAETARAYDAGYSLVTHFYNGVSSHRKRVQTVLAGIVEATYLDDRVRVELIGDGCHIPREDIYLAMKIKGAENVSVITDASRIAGTDLKSGRLGSLKTGTDIIVDNGVAKLPDLTSFAGSIATMDRCLRVLCADYGVDMPTASVLLSLAPAKCMGVEKTKGSIAEGKDADLVLVDRDLTIANVIVGGEILVGK